MIKLKTAILTSLIITSVILTGIISTTTSKDIVTSTQYVGTRQAVNYTQLCLDFIQQNYPNRTLNGFTSYIDGPDRETNYTYTVVFANLLPSIIFNSPQGDPVTTSIRHDTLNLEFGRDQISRDWDEYYDSLPEYYKKIQSNGRKSIVSNIGYLPMPSDPILGEYCTKAGIHFDPENQTIVIDKIEDMGASPIYDYDGDEIDDDWVQANLTLENILILANESYVSGIGFYGVYDYVPSSTGTPFTGLMMMISTALLLAVLFRTRRIRRKKL